MQRALVLSCSLALLAGCADELVIGSAPDMQVSDGGLSPAEIDRALAQYAKDIAGVWVGPNSTTLTFATSEAHPRSGTVRVEAFPDLYCIVFDCVFDVDAGSGLPPSAARVSFDAEYWMLKLDGVDGVVSLLPPDDEPLPISFNCTYIPRTQPILECGFRAGAFAVFLRRPGS